VIRITNVSKSYAGRIAVDGVTLHLQARQTHVLIGSSGAGKSTLLRLLVGLENPDRGTIEIDGKHLQTGAGAKPVGYVPQEGGLFPHMTGRQNATVVARVRRWPKPRIAARLEELRDLVGLEAGLLDSLPGELSGGQRQRVAIMRAAFLDPAVMILDEPLGALDPLIRNDLQDELKAIFNRMGKTVVLVTHDLGEAAFFGHTVTLMHEGRVVQSGPMDELLKRPVTPFVTRFIHAQRTIRGLEGDL
jgi:osmoprotectant transport system ATP-binding protein